MSESILANKVAKMLFTLAKENNVLTEVSNDLTISSKVILAEKNFITLMNNPNITKEQKSEFIDKSFAGVNNYVKNVIKILASDQKISSISEVFTVFTKMKNAFSNAFIVKVESVYELSEEEMSKLKNNLKSKLEADEIVVENIVNKSLLGGLRISYNGKVIDYTVKSKIQDMKRNLSLSNL